MELEVKKPEHIVPSYSLTGDLLSYSRCRLQYRYHNGSALPPSRPVQLWFGEFLHGTLEIAFDYWKSKIDNGLSPGTFPWPCTPREWGRTPPTWVENDIGRFAHIIETSLRSQGKQARSAAARESAYERIKIAINELGPHLFPLIVAAERKVIGTRPVPDPKGVLRCNNYEVHGIIDVLTHITLSRANETNIIKRSIKDICPDLNGVYEVIVDYKGARRPNTNEDYWHQGDWQVQTYAWLRQNQPDALKVAAGILIYINELTPGAQEMQAIQKGLKTGDIDVLPNAKDLQNIRMWRPGMSTDQISPEYRLQRAIRVVPITQSSITTALNGFDDVVRNAEVDIMNESKNGNIIESWFPNCKDEATCSACDFRHFCPKPAGVKGNYVIEAPSAP